MAKLMMKLTVVSFRSTKYMPPPIPGLMIVPVDEGSPIWKLDELP